jgi:uncharacterized protein with NRDE domain
MCTLVAAFRMYDAFPLVVAANRDERLDRPAAPPSIWPGGFLAPTDREGGGTWLGLTAGGMFVGVTNRFGVPRDPARLSRGALVADALGAASAAALHSRLVALPARRHNAFHLLYADREDAFVTWSDGAALRQERLQPGLHVVTERSLGADDHGRVEVVRDLWRALPPGPPPAEALEKLLAVHGDDPTAGTCVHLPDFGYGTRSSAVLRLSRTGGALRWAEGKPCETPFSDLAPLVATLFQNPPRR